MKLSRKLLLITFVFVSASSFWMSASAQIQSGEDEQQAVAIEDVSSDAASDGKLLKPKDLSDTIYSGKKSDSSMMWSVLLFVFMVIVILGFWIYTKWGGNGLRKLATSNELHIRETKALGNRQFLVVVEYGEQRMLLGVAPGMINHLCYLEAPADDEMPDQQ